jgi:L-lactate dehydrogenase complex protein LldG
VNDARAVTLGRVRRAISGAPAPDPVRRPYQRAGRLDRAGRVALFCERVSDYRAEAHLVAPRQLRAAIAEAFAGSGAARIVVPAGLPDAWRPAGIEIVEDAGHSPQELDRFDGVLSACTVAIAQTGTIILAGGPAEGRRALTLVPDLHVCVVEDTQIVEVVPEAMSRLGDLAAERRAITFISGPSATSDIELNRVEGVHGPRTLVVLVLERNP